MSSRRLLVVTYYYPPQPGSGSSRWAAMCEHLRRAGHEVRVVTAAPPGHGAGADGDVVRTGNLNSNPLLRRVLLRAGRGDAGAGAPASAPEATVVTAPTGEGVLPPALWKAIVPDPWLVTWNPSALIAVRRLLASWPADCLITSSPANSTHLLGLALRRRPPWVADFRDGWLFEPLLPPFPLRPQRALNAAMERRRVAQHADAVVAVTRPIAEDFHARLGVAAEHVPNGWDPMVATSAADGMLEHDGRVNLLHAGAMSGPWGRDPRGLLEALRRLQAEEPARAQRIRLVLAGRFDDTERELLSQYADLGELLRPIGQLPREQVLAMQRAADVLVLITSRNRGEATGKIYEYMAAGRPVLALASGNEAARIVEETNIGLAVAPDDVDAITDALRAALDGGLERSYAPRLTERYSYPGVAEQMAAVVEQAIERHASRGGQARAPSRR